MKRTIVTGGSGFVGANLVRFLLREGHETHLLLRPGHAVSRIEEIRDDARLHIVDLQDAASVSKMVRAIKPDWVFHLAAHGGYSWQRDVKKIYDTNIGATVNLLEACKVLGFEAFIHTGSSSEYGLKNHAPTEDEWIEPNSPYACAKAAATLYCRHVSQAANAHIVTLRLYSAFGPHEDSNRLIPKMIEFGQRREYPPLVNVNTARDFIYIDDVCEACLLAAKTPSERGSVYNLGTGIQTTLRQVSMVARQTFGLTTDPQWGSMPARIWDTSTWVANNKKIRAELGWSPKFTFEQGFLDMVRKSNNHRLGPG